MVSFRLTYFSLTPHSRHNQAAPFFFSAETKGISRCNVALAFSVHIACPRDAMNSGYYAACTGLMARTEALETIANNLANVSTTGFRASHNVFSSLLATTGDSPLSVLNQDANDYGVLSGTRHGYFPGRPGKNQQRS